MIFDILADVRDFIVLLWPLWVLIYLTYWWGPSLRRADVSGKLRFYAQFTDVVFTGKRVLIVDIENTLALRGVRFLGKDVRSTFERAWAEGVQLICLLTNKRRSEPDGSGDFSKMQQQLEDIGFKVIIIQPRFKHPFKWPRKPYRLTFRWARYRCGWPRKDEILAGGDKVRWDVLRPIKLGWSAFVVNPLGDDGRADRILLTRPIENLTLDWFGLERWGRDGIPQLRWFFLAVVADVALINRVAFAFDTRLGWLAVAASVVVFTGWVANEGLKAALEG